MEQQHQFPQTTQQQPQNQTRAEAERLLGVAEKLLHNRDLTGSREFALLAQETDPVLEGSEQILAITDVLLASESRVNNNRHHDWYSILQSQKRAEPDLLRKNYRRLALLLHPDKNNYPLSDAAFKLVADAWSVLSDATKRTPYDHELSLYSKVDLRHQHPNAPDNNNKDKLPVRRSARADAAAGSNVTAPPHFANRNPNPNPNPNANANANVNVNVSGDGDGDGGNFWTACPYCYVIYEYPRVYKEYCIRCQNCDRAFHATDLPSLPPMVPGKEAYYCCWGFFPIGFSLEGGDKGKPNNNDGDNNVTAANAASVPNNVASAGNVNIVSGLSAAGAGSVPNNGNGNGNGGNNNNPNMGFPNWMPGMFNTPGGDGAATTPQNHGANVNVNNVPSGNMNAAGVGVSGGSGGGSVDFSGGSGTAPGFGNAMQGITGQGAKKRGRPRKNPLGL